MYVVTPEEMREIDWRAIDEIGIPGIVLMENAALRIVDVIEEVHGIESKKSRVLVVSGIGNNGGDGIAVARHLFLKGIDTELILLGDPSAVKGDAKTNLDIACNIGVPIQYVNNMEETGIVEEKLSRASIVVDAVFGTGLSRNVEGIFCEVISRINNSGVPVIAVDIPSGINGENGHVMGIAVRAQDTVTFGYPKQGHILFPGREYTGRLHVVPISLPDDSANAIGVKGFTLDDDEMAGLLKERPPRGHKGTFGKVCVIAGSTGMTGAACLTAMAGLRGGAGLVTLGIPASLNPIIEVKLTEVMSRPLCDEGTGHLVPKSLEGIQELIKQSDVLAIGPGLGKNPAVREILWNIFGKSNISIVVDADALNNISEDIELLAGHPKPVVITPHPGEMSRLIGKPVKEVTDFPIEAARDLSQKLGIVVLLKGAATVVASPDGQIYLNRSGNSGMGTGGSGDVLTGFVASLMAQGYSAFESAVYGCYIHGRAGDLAAGALGVHGMVAGDILDAIPKVLKGLYQGSGGFESTAKGK